MTVDIYKATESDDLSTVERALYDLIMDYRKSLGLPEIPLSTNLTVVAGRHALDTHFNIWEANLTLPKGANLHSWSDAPYYSDHSQPKVMWDAPDRLGTAYPGNGYEISAAGYNSVEEALEGWKKSPGHNAVMANTGIWADSDWSAIGVGVYQPDSYDHSLPYGGFVYHVWFGTEADPEGGPGTDSDPAPPVVTVATLTTGVDLLTLAAGEILDVPTPEHLFSDTIEGFSHLNKIVFDAVSLSRDRFTFDPATGTLGLDTDGDGTADGSVTVAGDFSGGDFMAVAGSGDTSFSFESFLPGLREKQAVDASTVNGIANTDFLTGNGSRAYRVTLEAIGEADRDNALGVYEVDATGALVDVRLLYVDTGAGEGIPVDVTGVEEGHRLGFFLLQDGADRIAGLSGSDTLAFVDAGGGPGNLSDGASLQLAKDGVALDLTVFHSLSSTLNADGAQHVLSGVAPGGHALRIGFEDVEGLGDRDYQDVVLHVQGLEDGLV